MIRNQNYFTRSQEALLSMDMDSDSEAIYEDPEVIKKSDFKKPTPQNISPIRAGDNRPPRLLPKKKDIGAAVFQTSNGQVSLHPAIEEALKKRHWNPPTIENPTSDSRRLAVPGLHKGYLGASMPEVNNMKKPDTIRKIEPIRSNRMERNERYLSVSDSHYLPPQRQNFSKDDSCCQHCCFFLLYVLIVFALGVFFLHVYHPEILDPNYMKHSIEIETIKKDYGMLRRFLRAYCKDYINGLENETIHLNQHQNTTINVQLTQKSTKNLFTMCKNKKIINLTSSDENN